MSTPEHYIVRGKDIEYALKVLNSAQLGGGECYVALREIVAFAKPDPWDDDAD